MISVLQGWQGPVRINDVEYDSINAYSGNLKEMEPFSIVLLPKKAKSQVDTHPKAVEADTEKEVVITVKPYMTKQSEPGFDFMAKWNNDVPMPLRTMVGYKVKETPGMVYMKLHGDILQEKTVRCMCCGRKLTNPVSQYFGIGPECGGHNYTHPFDTEEELRAAVAEYKVKVQNMTWEGWIIKSAIKEEKEI